MLSLRSEPADAGSSAIVISMLDEIAWLLNLYVQLVFLCVAKMHVNPVYRLFSYILDSLTKYKIITQNYS